MCQDRPCPRDMQVEEGNAQRGGQRGGPGVVEGPLRRAFVSQLRPTYCLDLVGQDPLGELPDQDVILEIGEGGALDIPHRAPSEA